tara:strand:- start:1656 stop:2189 length:534 start_codon:yes stop_codon:yes gene_type:complete
MKLDLFSIPIWIGNIDVAKVTLQSSKLEKNFLSDVASSYSQGSSIDETSSKYLLDVIINLLDQDIIRRYTLDIINIWENHYYDSDFQENHIHVGSDLSFIIYKKIDESKTVFLNPSYKLLNCFYANCKFKSVIFGKENFVPECRENQIIIFPSYLEHMVRKSSNTITIAGNLKITFN